MVVVIKAAGEPWLVLLMWNSLDAQVTSLLRRNLSDVSGGDILNEMFYLQSAKIDFLSGELFNFELSGFGKLCLKLLLSAPPLWEVVSQKTGDYEGKAILFLVFHFAGQVFPAVLPLQDLFPQEHRHGKIRWHSSARRPDWCCQGVGVVRLYWKPGKIRVIPDKDPSPGGTSQLWDREGKQSTPKMFRTSPQRFPALLQASACFWMHFNTAFILQKNWAPFSPQGKLWEISLFWFPVHHKYPGILTTTLAQKWTNG